MVLVSAAAVSSFFLATAAFFRGFTDPTTTRRPLMPTSFPKVPLGLRFGAPAVDHLEEEASSNSINNNNLPASSDHQPTLHTHHHTVGHHDGKLFPSRLDNIDMDRILNNRRLVHNYVGCMVNKKPCTAEGKEFKRSLPDVLLTECAKCSPQMQRNIEHMVHVLQKEYPLEWSMLVKHYDPDGSYQKRYTQYLLQVHAHDHELDASTTSTKSTKNA